MCFLAMPAWAQTEHYSVPAASVEDAFVAYHEALSGAADGLLAQSAPASGLQSPDTQQPDDRGLHGFAQQYWDGQDRSVRRAADRVALLRPILDPILHEAGVPLEVNALMLVESGGLPTALSSKGALGLWQFMPETARRYGLVVSSTVDERADVVKSTRAAAHYLRDLYSQFGEWKLAFAAYNAGEKTVQHAMQHGARDFETLSRDRQLPLETRNYVPAVLSAVHLLGGALPVPARPLQRTSKARVIYADSAPDN
jgi:membrane-bound lytic murein transglycosylase D